MWTAKQIFFTLGISGYFTEHNYWHLKNIDWSSELEHINKKNTAALETAWNKNEWLGIYICSCPVQILYDFEPRSLKLRTLFMKLYVQNGKFCKNNDRD
jgi:hypothetical protein